MCLQHACPGVLNLANRRRLSARLTVVVKETHFFAG